MAVSNDNLLTLEEAADFTGYVKLTIYNKVRSGEIPAVRIRNKIYIEQTHLEPLVKGQEYAPRKNNRSSN